MNLETLVRANILKLKPYSSARDEFMGEAVVRLDANESPFETEFNRYPDPYQKELKQVIADIKGIPQENIILGNGSDELIDIVIRTFCEPKVDSILALKPSYGMYKVSAGINDVALKEVELNENFDIDAQVVLAEADETTKLILLCSPNNPTGNCLDVKEVEKILRNFNGVVVIDEAYIDFSENESWIKRLNECRQLVVIQTLSKFYGLAGLRVGLAYASSELIGFFNKVKPPYNLSEAAQNLAIQALTTKANQNRITENYLSQKARLYNYFKNSELVEKVYPSEANFYLVKFKEAAKVFKTLQSKGIIVRDRTKEFNCQNCLRISIGNEKDNNKLITALNDIQ